MNTPNLIVGAIVGYALFVIGYAVLSPHSLAAKNKWSLPGVAIETRVIRAMMELK
jgi:hypothetical protein